MIDPEPGVHRSAAILSIGDEIILGQALDTNAQWLSARLLDLGVRTVEHRTVADDLPALRAALEELAGRVDLLLTTGGLGPTSDDLTREALAQAAGEELVEDAPSLEQIARWFRGAERPMPERNRVQALRPVSARCLKNHHGTAPGLAVRLALGEGACDVFCLPGPPHEMRAMFERDAAPRVHAPTGRVVLTRVLHTFGMGESDAAQALGELMNRGRNPLVGTTASDGVVSCRIRYEGDTPREQAQRLVDAAAAQAHAALGDVIFGEGDDTLASVALEALRARGASLATVESCTGGMLGAALTAVPGASDVYTGGWITYADEMKSGEVGVDPALIERHGAVSEAVARAMAIGALEAPLGPRPVEHAVSITGVAGPGGTRDKPPGMVWIALAARRDGEAPRVEARLFRFPGDRLAVRVRTTQTALALLGRRLRDLPRRRVLWEVEVRGDTKDAVERH